MVCKRWVGNFNPLVQAQGSESFRWACIENVTFTFDLFMPAFDDPECKIIPQCKKTVYACCILKSKMILNVR